LKNVKDDKTSNDTRYKQNAWQWSKGSGAKENVSFTIKPFGLLNKKYNMKALIKMVKEIQGVSHQLGSRNS
jgi:hypothetical protein